MSWSDRGVTLPSSSCYKRSADCLDSAASLLFPPEPRLGERDPKQSDPVAATVMVNAATEWRNLGDAVAEGENDLGLLFDRAKIKQIVDELLEESNSEDGIVNRHVRLQQGLERIRSILTRKGSDEEGSDVSGS